MTKKKLHIAIDEEVLEKLEKVAKERGLRTNELVRFILSDFLLTKVD